MAKETGFYRGNREAPAASRHQFHLVLTQADHEKLQSLTHSMKMSAADVIRTLVRKAKVPA